MSLKDKNILIGITGGIAAYKVCDLIRKFVKLNANVKAVITPSAKEFVTETTLATLTRNPVYCDIFNIENWKPEHVSLADNTDLFIIAPATANTIGKIANGICDNLLTSLAITVKKPIILAPAMNCNMWENNFLQKNLQTLENSGFYIVLPETGELACGYSGMGRMADIDKVFNKAMEILQEDKFLTGQKILITAGGTKEEIDPVRYIGNYSSGKMGTAIADEAFKFGAEVCLVTSVKVDKPYKTILVNSAVDMFEEVKNLFPNFNTLIMAAAVADYRPKNREINKIKKSSKETLTLELIKNPDILKEIAKIKNSEQKIIGFCAESENLCENAKIKLKEKNLDFIVANDISTAETGFNSDYNEVTIIDKNLEMLNLAKNTKNEIAKSILKNIFG